MRKKTGTILKITAWAVLVLSMWNLLISIYDLTLPSQSHSEFDAMHNFFQGLILIVICILSAVLFISGFFLFRYKKWAYIVSLLLLLAGIPLNDLVHTPELLIHISDGADIGVLKEVLPMLLAALLVLCFKDFWAAAKHNRAAE